MTLTNRDIVALASISGVGPVSIARLIDSGYAKTRDDRVLPPKIAEALSDNARRNSLYAHADRQFDLAMQEGVEIVTRIDARYPDLLQERAEAPPVLYAKGNLGVLQRPAIGVIGTREPTAHGELATQRITAFFAMEGYAVVSGLALGCDAIAHEECVRLGRPAIAILAHGLHTIAPKRNAALAQRILDAGGLLLSEFAVGVEPQPQFFVQRDKTQALMSEAIVMMQSDLNGGSLHASRAALRFGRALIVPHPTATDIANAEPKIQANLLLSQGDAQSKTELLKCSSNDLSRVFILRGKEDYSRVAASIHRGPVPSQQLLI